MRALRRVCTRHVVVVSQCRARQHGIECRSVSSMSGVSRSFRTAQRAFLPVRNPPSYQQQRLAGDLPVKPNKYIEDWGTYRENVEYTFKWNLASFTKIAFFAMAVPATIYTVAVKEFDKTDAKYNRPKRDFLGDVQEKR